MGLFSKPEVIGPGGANDGDRARLAELERRVAQLEAQVAQLAGASAGPAASPAASPAGAVSAEQPWLAEVQRLVREGKKINAIKVYRESTGAGLKEAKDAVEAM